MIDLAALELLGAHVSRGADSLILAGELRRLGQPGETKVENRGPAVGRDKDVRRLDVAMNNTLPVRRCQALGDLSADFQDVLQRQRTDGNSIFERLAFQESHRQECLAAILVDLVDRTDVGVMQSGGGLSLPKEPLLGLFVVQQMRGQELEGHIALELLVLGSIHNTHAALAELLDDAVVADRPADHDAQILTPPESSGEGCSVAHPASQLAAANTPMAAIAAMRFLIGTPLPVTAPAPPLGRAAFIGGPQGRHRGQTRSNRRLRGAYRTP